ncbi:MAG: lipopolysaccharide transport system ATP-binding protein [Chloroflexota bacterium]|nr:lipopolysaccharide transport system ATP-binding protein [Chloroflexota bacterium]
MPNAIELEGVTKSFKVFHRRHSTLKETLLRRRRAVFEQVTVLDHVSLDIPEGQALGIIGRNGAGKSTMLKVIAGLMTPDEGTVTVRGRVSTLLELGAGFQGEYSGRENVYLYSALMGLSRRFIDERFDEIVEFSGIENYIDNPVKTYSSGMYARLAFAVAVHVDPDILIIDEVLAVGDRDFQRKCFARAADLRRRGKTIVLVSHDLESVRRICDRAVWLDGGKLLADGKPQDVAQGYVASVTERSIKAGFDDDQAHLEDVRVLDASGAPVASIKTDEPAIVSFRISTPVAMGAAHLVVRWVAENGTIMASSSTIHDGPVSVPAGGADFACHFDRMPLVPDSYRIEVVALDPETSELLHPIHDTVLVAVLGKPVEGMVSVASRWETGGDSRVRSAGGGGVDASSRE